MGGGGIKRVRDVVGVDGWRKMNMTFARSGRGEGVRRA